MNINVIGVPLFYGCDREGVDLGPNELRKHGLLDKLEKHHKINDLGNIKVDVVSSEDKFSCHSNMKYLSAVTKSNEDLAKEVYSSLKNSSFPLIIGGDHSLALGSLAGSSKYYGQDLGVIWIDAHGDINTDLTSPSGNIHGMPLAASMGIGNQNLIDLFYKGPKINLNNVFILAARDLDEGELELIKENNLNVWTISDIKEKGLDTCLSELLDKVKLQGLNNIHLSFDIDSLDPIYTPGTGTPVHDGLTLDEGKKVLHDILSTNIVRSIDFVEFNPILDETDTTINTCLSLIEEISKSL